MIVPLDIKKVGHDINMYIHAPEDDIGVSKYIAENKVWEPYETTIFCEILEGKSFFIDVGANLGYYSLIAAKHFNNEGVVISLEPEQNNYVLLKENIALNSLNNMSAIQVACSDTIGQATIKKSDNNYGDHRVEIDQVNKGIDSIETTTVDALIRRENKIPDVIKIDTQGSELSILYGMHELLENLTENTLIILEYWPHGIVDRGQSPRGLLDYLEKFELDMLIMHEETSVISQCDLEDLRRWTKTILKPESEHYVNLIFGKKSNRDIIKLKEKFTAKVEPFQFNKIYSSISNQRLNSALNPIGWSYPEEHGVWNNGHYAEMEIRDVYFDKENRDYYLKLNIYPFLAEGKILFQRVKIRVNNNEVGEYKLDRMEMKELKITLPERVLLTNEGVLTVSFEFLDSHCPKEYELSSDARLLSILLNGYGIYCTA